MNPILYIGGTLPTLSETFVYREVFALRERGVPVVTASVHRPQERLGSPGLDALAAETVSVYGPGIGAMLRDAAGELVRRPMRTLGTFGLALRDVFLSRDITLGRRPKVFVQALGGIALARRVRNRGVAHVHAHMAHVPTTIAMYAARQLGVTFSFTGHANDLFPQRTLLAEKLRRAQFVACISHWHRAFYRQVAAELPDERLPIVRCGVAIPDERVAARRVSGPLRVLAVGRLVPKKGFDLLVRAVARLRGGGMDLHCQIIGDGSQQAELETLVRQSGAGSHIELAGARAHDAVLAALRAADVFVLPCRVDAGGDRDGIPVVLMEAMAAGLCVITGDLPTIRELVRPDETGLLIAPGDLEALVAALRRVAGDAELCTRLAAAGRAWVADEFATARNAERLLAAFDGLLSAPDHPPRVAGASALRPLEASR